MKRRILWGTLGVISIGLIVGCAAGDPNNSDAIPPTTPSIGEEPDLVLNFPPSPMEWVEQIPTRHR